jgi:hypothetical protein
MTHDRTLGEVEADLAALRAAADRAGLALARLFAAGGERDGTIGPRRRSSPLLTVVLAFAFLMM